MPQMLPADFSAQLSSILNAYSTVSESGDIPATAISGGNPAAVLTSSGNDVLASLTSLSTLDPASLGTMINNFALPAFSIGSMVLSLVAVSVLRYAKEKVKARIWARTFDKRAKKFLKRYDTERGGQEALVKSILGQIEKTAKAPQAVQAAPVQTAPVQTPPPAPVFQIPPIPPIPTMPPHATQI